MVSSDGGPIRSWSSAAGAPGCLGDSLLTGSWGESVGCMVVPLRQQERLVVREQWALLQLVEEEQPPHAADAEDRARVHQPRREAVLRRTGRDPPRHVDRAD